MKKQKGKLARKLLEAGGLLAPGEWKNITDVRTERLPDGQFIIVKRCVVDKKANMHAVSKALHAFEGR